MPSRLRGRVSIVARAATQALCTAGGRRRPTAPRRILVAHHLLLGDTLMLTPLLAKLRERYAEAEIIMTVPRAFAPLYETRPYGVRALPFDPRDSRTLRALWPEAGFDLAIVPGDNRYSWLALALGARWIVAFANDRPAYKSWPVDELIPYPTTPAAWGDMVAGLVPGPAPQSFAPGDWAAPACQPFERPRAPYCVLHVGASSPLKRWAADKWCAFADALAQRGFEIVWSGGRGEEAVVGEIDAVGRYRNYAGRLDLAQLFALLTDAALLVSPDTGVAHLGRIVNVPTLTLFGPGSALLCGAGDFWRGAPYRAVTIPDFPCRDQRVLFKREIDWVRRCGRSTKECPAPRCMQAIRLAEVLDAAYGLARLPAHTSP